MRDHRKSKILLQGLLPKYKAELYLRMPENTEDFDALCKLLFISKKILHTKEATDDKEMSAVIAGITHHEKQQDDIIQLLQQKLSEALSELKCTNTKRGSPQENDVTIAATGQYEKERPRSSKPDFHFTNVPHIGTTTPTGKETTTDQTLTATDIKHVITASNIYSSNSTLATTLEPLKIQK
ncbi:hypothetical protein OUZ56_012357 [Daphnia magna]|uniref:Uncharacterized protein n=1 Tax=Daphnia magna TaxID=35525 RepID=A0ABQ9Z2R9_9CRUS|nr:hypothetical protein OUZ56_012357 [Daphnia magna]